jgi:hypothetical protein
VPCRRARSNISVKSPTETRRRYWLHARESRRVGLRWWSWWGGWVWTAQPRARHQQPARLWGPWSIRTTFRLSEIVPLHPVQRAGFLRGFVLGTTLLHCESMCGGNGRGDHRCDQRPCPKSGRTNQHQFLLKAAGTYRGWRINVAVGTKFNALQTSLLLTVSSERWRMRRMAPREAPGATLRRGGRR